MEREGMVECTRCRTRASLEVLHEILADRWEVWCQSCGENSSGGSMIEAVEQWEDMNPGGSCPYCGNAMGAREVECYRCARRVPGRLFGAGDGVPGIDDLAE